MLNHIIVMGRLTKDPELRYTNNAKPVATFTLACDRDYTPHGEEKKADFINCVAWSGTAEFVSKYFAKGDTACVSGRLQMRDWTDKDGNKRIAAEIIANSIYFGGAKKTAESKLTELPADDGGELPF